MNRLHGYYGERAVRLARPRADSHQDDARRHRVTTRCIEHGGN
jgi:hypothetical protein